MSDNNDKHVIVLLITVDDKPISWGRVKGGELDATLVCARLMGARALRLAEDMGKLIDESRERYEADIEQSKEREDDEAE